MTKERNLGACALCAAIRLDNPAVDSIYNTPLDESTHFLILPSIGPVCVGHVLVVSKIHGTSMAAMTPDVVDDYHKLLERIVRERELYQKDLLQVEHGSTSDDCGGACVVHTHVHLIPEHGVFADALVGIVPELQNGTDHRWLPADEPYIYLRCQDQPPKVHDGGGLPSQFIRQLICSHRGGEWDWRKDERRLDIMRTISYWKAAK